MKISYTIILICCKSGMNENQLYNHVSSEYRFIYKGLSYWWFFIKLVRN